MGWFRDESGLEGHEGFAVGFIERDGVTPGSLLWRELLYPGDSECRTVARISAGCACGWRSEHLVPEHGTRWEPFSVSTKERDDDRIRELWNEHVDQVLARRRLGRV